MKQFKITPDTALLLYVVGIIVMVVLLRYYNLV